MLIRRIVWKTCYEQRAFISGKVICVFGCGVIAITKQAKMGQIAAQLLMWWSSPQIIPRKIRNVFCKMFYGIKSPIEPVVICDRTAIRTAILQAQPEMAFDCW